MSQQGRTKDPNSTSLSPTTNDRYDILLVEDDKDHVALIVRGLERFTTSIHHVKDGKIALDYLAGCNGNLPHIILLDLRLPKIDGLEVLRSIKTSDRLKHVPVIVLTTSESEIDIARAYNGYANSYLVKPIDFDKFQNLMGDLGLYWLKCNARL